MSERKDALYQVKFFKTNYLVIMLDYITKSKRDLEKFILIS